MCSYASYMLDFNSLSRIHYHDDITIVIVHNMLDVLTEMCNTNKATETMINCNLPMVTIEHTGY